MRGTVHRALYDYMRTEKYTKNNIGHMSGTMRDGAELCRSTRS
jgi:hypothetical protein